MSGLVVAGAVGYLVGGPVGGLIGFSIPTLVARLRQKEPPQPPRRLVLLLLLVELRSGRSVLSSLQEVSAALPEYQRLESVVRIAAVSGLTRSIAHANDDLRPLIAQLARSQQSGASLAETVRRFLERDIAEERACRLARARSLPVKLMMPVTLLMLPGLVLMLYAPSLIALFSDLTGVLH